MNAGTRTPLVTGQDDTTPQDATSPAEPTESDAEDGVDFGWVMQVTFVLTIVVGAPLVAVLSTGITLPTWEARVSFAVRVGAVVWLGTAVGTYVYARRSTSSRSSQSET